MPDVNESGSSSGRWTKFALVLVFVGIALRIILLLINQGLSEAESHLAINFVRRSLGGILTPLDHGQVAPPLFLVIEKISMSVFGQNEYALRWFPCACSCAALVLFYRFLRTHTNDRVLVVGVAMMAINRSLIMTAVSAKQYSSDLLLCIILFSILFNPRLDHQRRFLWLALVGAVGVWCSHVSIFVLFSIGVFSLTIFFGASVRQRLAIIGAWIAWAAAFACLYLTMIAKHPNAGIMLTYWNEHFMPLIPKSANDLSWFSAHFRDMISYALGFSGKHTLLWLPFGICFVAGVVHCFRNKQYRFLLWTGLPMVVHLLLSAFRLYPFYARLILYLEFPIIVFMAIGLISLIPQTLITMFPKWNLLPRVCAATICVIMIIGLIDYPYPMEDIKKSLSVVRDNFQSGDQIYVYYPVDAAFEFYQQKYIPENAHVVFGKESRTDPKRYLDQLAPMNGRVWLVFSHLYTDPATKVAEDTYIVDRLGKRGEILSAGKSFFASVYLMDLHPNVQQ